MHLWPRDKYVLIAMPNKNKTFTCNLFFPRKGELSFESKNTPELFEAFVKEAFPDAADKMPDIKKDYQSKSMSHLIELSCYPWVRKNYCLVGDASHSILPFYGQGCNRSLEDCLILSDLMDKHRGNWTLICETYQELRRPTAEAIAALANHNFEVLKSEMATSEHAVRTQLINYLSDVYPEYFKALFQIVVFSNTNYVKAKDFI